METELSFCVADIIWSQFLTGERSIQRTLDPTKFAAQTQSRMSDFKAVN